MYSTRMLPYCRYFLTAIGMLNQNRSYQRINWSIYDLTRRKEIILWLTISPNTPYFDYFFRIGDESLLSDFSKFCHSYNGLLHDEVRARWLNVWDAPEAKHGIQVSKRYQRRKEKAFRLWYHSNTELPCPISVPHSYPESIASGVVQKLSYRAFTASWKTL